MIKLIKVAAVSCVLLIGAFVGQSTADVTKPPCDEVCKGWINNNCGWFLFLSCSGTVECSGGPDPITRCEKFNRYNN